MSLGKYIVFVGMTVPLKDLFVNHMAWLCAATGVASSVTFICDFKKNVPFQVLRFAVLFD